MAKTAHITAEQLRAILRYDPESGVFIWKERDVCMFKSGKQTAEHNCHAWNRRNAGKQAGTVKAEGYIEIVISRHKYYAHRLAFLYMLGEYPTCEVDHWDGCGTNNRFRNLRLADRSRQTQNTRLRSNNTSGHKGVSWDKTKRKWVAVITCGGNIHHIGRFADKGEAISAYRVASMRLHGEFSYLTRP